MLENGPILNVLVAMFILGIVMMSFSPNDSFFLTAGIDNEIKQYYTLHGGLHKAYDVPKLNCSNNFTRAYYCNVNTKNTNCSGDNIVVCTYPLISFIYMQLYIHIHCIEI